MPLFLLNRAFLRKPSDPKMKLSRLAGPDIDLFVTAEIPAISIQVAPALEDLAALTDGIPADFRQQMERLLEEQTRAGLPPARVVSMVIGEKPDYALLRAHPDSLSPAEWARQTLEGLKLLGRRQNFGVFLGDEEKSGLAGCKKGTGLVDLGLDVASLMDKTGAPFAIRLRSAELAVAANAEIARKALRYDLAGEECEHGPLEFESVAVRGETPGELETLVSGQLMCLHGGARTGFEVAIRETLGVDERGRLADSEPAIQIEVAQVEGDTPTEYSLLQELANRLLPIAAALVSGARLAEPQSGTGGPAQTTLNRLLAPRLVLGTNRKIAFYLKRAEAQHGTIALAGLMQLAVRKQNLRIHKSATGKLANGHEYDIAFKAVAGEMVEPVVYTWACLGEEYSGGAKATFRVDLAAHPEFPVTVEAVDAEGFTAPVVRAQFRQSGLEEGARVTLTGEPVPR